jgi:hypothetical protein
MKSRIEKRMLLTTAIVTSKTEIHHADFLKRARKHPQDFTRKRKMPFVELVIFMLNMVKTSTQTSLDRFYENIGQEGMHMSQQSFSEARQKINWEAFRDLFDTIRNEIYEHYYDTWHGYRVTAIDGSKIQLPDEQILRDYYGTMGKSHNAATAQASALYDVLNNVLIDAQLEPLETGERKLALRHIDELCCLTSFDKECILFDRGYASNELIQALRARGIRFVMRIKRKFNTSIDRLGEGDHTFVLKNNGCENQPLRVLKFTLPSGEEETLLTDITDQRMGHSSFQNTIFQKMAH